MRLLQDPAFQLILLVFGIHLVDAGRLLWANEGLLLNTGFSWRAMTGSDAWRIAGRRLVLPLLFRPALLLRLTWQAEAVRPAATGSAVQDVLALRPLMVWGWTLSVLMFVMLPLTWALSLGDGVLAAVLVTIYCQALGLALHLAVMRRQLGMTPGRLLGCALECLVCPPLAVTLVARLSARKAVTGDFLATAESLLPTQRWAVLRERTASQLREEAEDAREAGDAAAAQRLEQRRAAVQGLPISAP